MYGKLKQYLEENNNTSMPIKKTKLGKWIGNQRSRRKIGKVSEERIQLLDEIGFSWDPFEEEWRETYQLLKKYIEEYSNANVPQRHRQLGSWVQTQRNNRKSEKLSEERIKLLDDVDFIWDPKEEEWQEKYQLLKQYIKEHGNANIPQRHPQLGKWIHNQRTTRKSGIIPKERIILLDKIGFIWDPLEEKWKKNYELLKAYFEEYGNCKVPEIHSQLGKWVGNLRTARKKINYHKTRLNC